MLEPARNITSIHEGFCELYNDYVANYASSSIDRVYLQIDKVVVVLLLVLAVMIQRLKLET